MSHERIQKNTVASVRAKMDRTEVLQWLKTGNFSNKNLDHLSTPTVIKTTEKNSKNSLLEDDQPLSQLIRKFCGRPTDYCFSFREPGECNYLTLGQARDVINNDYCRFAIIQDADGMTTSGSMSSTGFKPWRPDLQL